MGISEELALIYGCIAKDRQSEFRLYQHFAPRLLPVCRSYSRTLADAEDIMQEGFIKVFRYLSDYSQKGSFEGWLRRIMITTALNFYKKKRRTYTETELNYMPDYAIAPDTVTSDIHKQEIHSIIDDLPDGYRKVFSMNVIEGYSHKEIGKMLNISESTSKTQLLRARSSLRKRYLLYSRTAYSSKELIQTA